MPAVLRTHTRFSMVCCVGIRYSETFPTIFSLPLRICLSLSLFFLAPNKPNYSSVGYSIFNKFFYYYLITIFSFYDVITFTAMRHIIVRCMARVGGELCGYIIASLATAEILIKLWLTQYRFAALLARTWSYGHCISRYIILSRSATKSCISARLALTKRYIRKSKEKMEVSRAFIAFVPLQ